MSVRESQIEDVLATYPVIAKQVLGEAQEMHLLARQMTVGSGRIDLLFSAGGRLILVELKAVQAEDAHLSQIEGYRKDLEGLQADGRLIRAPLECVLLCPSFPAPLFARCGSAGVRAATYDIALVMQAFFQQLRSLSKFVSVRPSDHGIWNLHLINRTLQALETQDSIASIGRAVSLSARSVGNHLRFAAELRLVERRGRNYVLTELGGEYNARADGASASAQLSEGQAECLRNFIVRDPFASPAVFGIYTMVDAVFTLARNTYPVTQAVLLPFFRDSCGKLMEWTSPTTAHHGVGMYSNYAADLGLLAVVGKDFYLTPDGLRFILLLQLHKSLQMVEVIQR